MATKQRNWIGITLLVLSIAAWADRKSVV